MTPEEDAIRKLLASMRFDDAHENFGTEILLNVYPALVLMINRESYGDLKPEDKKTVDQSLNVYCTGWLESPEFKSGDTTKNNYKLCCETVDYCSFLKSSWFLLICIGGGLFLVNIITIGLLICYFKCGKKGKNGGGGGENTPKKGGKSTGKTGKTGKSTGTPLY